MFTKRPQYLDIDCPSPTTVSFRVTTTTRNPSRLLNLLRHGFRIFLAILAILVTITKLHVSISSEYIDLNVLALSSFLPGFTTLTAVVERREWWMVLPLSFLIVYLCLKRDYVGKLLHTGTLTCANR
jgi:hypothetical protein